MTTHPYKFEWKWAKDIESLVNKNTSGKIINLCSGSSNIGNVKLDLIDVKKYYEDRKYKLRKWSGTPNMFADATLTPFKDSSFDTVVSDPPYLVGKGEMKFINYLKNEMVRLLKTGGTYIYYSFDIPFHSKIDIKQLFLKRNVNQPYHRILSIGIKSQYSLKDLSVGDS